MKRNAERATHPSPDPDDAAWLWRQKHNLLRVREEGDLAVQRRVDLKQGKGQRLQRLAEELRAEGRGAPNQCVLGLGRLYLAHLLGAGGWAKEREPDWEGLARRGAAGQPPAWEKRRVAGNREKSRREDLVRPQPCRTKSWRSVVGVERKGASKVAGWPHPPPGRPEKNKGTWGSFRKTLGSHCPADPRASRGLAAGKLWTAAAGATLLGEGEEDILRAGRRQSGRTARLVPGLKNNCLGPCPKGQVDSLVQLWPIDSTRGGGASPQVPPSQRRGKSRWQRELESAFEELFNINRKLKRHLSLHLSSRLGLDANPSEEWGSSEVHGRRGETRREKPVADAKMEMGPAREAGGLAEVGARHSSPRANPQRVLSKNQAYQRVVKPTFKGANPSSPEAGTLISEESLLWHCTESRHEPPRVDTRSLQLHPQSQADRADLVASKQKQKTEQRRLTQPELLELPEMLLEARGQTERGHESGAQARARPALSKAASLRDQEKEGVREHSPTAPPATSSSDDDDSRHSQMIRDRQEQMLAQNKSHRQFLEEARKRLRGFQSAL